MMGEGDWGWLPYRCREFRNAVSVVLDSEEQGELVEQQQLPEVEELVTLPPDVSARPWGGIPYVGVIGDTNQLPPVCKSAVYSTATPAAGTSSATGRIAFHDFLNPPDTDEAESVVIKLDEVLRQTEEHFLTLLDHMRTGNMTEEDAELLLARRMSILPEDERERFRTESLNLVPTWKTASKIIYSYLQHDLDTPISKFTAEFASSRTDGKNCCVKEVRLPTQSAHCKGAKVMLLKNFLVELGLMNGSVGTVIANCYKTREGPYATGGVDNKIQYSIVDFPESDIPEQDKFFDNFPRTYIPIPMIEERCERKCCSVRALPLRCCKALSIHKSQGMTVGPDKQFKYLTVHYPTGTANARSTPGLELVATSRVESLSYMAIGNDEEDLSKQLFTKIGTSKAYEARKKHLEMITERADCSKTEIMRRIAALDPNQNEDERTYEGGCDFLLGWYNDILNNT
jgi:hypothetical protein